MAKTLSLLLLFLELTFLIAFAEEINSLPQTYSPRYPPHHHHTSPSIAPAHVHNPLHPLLPAKPPTPHHPPAHAPIRPPASAPRQPPAHAPIHPPANTPRHPPAHALIRPPANAPQRPPAHAPIRPPASAPHHHHQSPSPAPTHHHHHHHHSPSPAPTHPHRHHHHHHDSPSHHHHHAHAPNHTPRSFIVVKGVVYVKSCEHARSDTLLDSTKLFGAIVKLQCNNTKHKFNKKVVTDKNGYFFIEGSKNVTSYGAHKCNVVLVSAPNGLKPSNLHGGVTGAALRPETPFISKGLPFIRYNVGPLAFEPKCHQKT